MEKKIHSSVRLRTQQLQIAARYQQSVNDLGAVIIETPTVAFEGDVPGIGETEAETRLSKIASDIAGLKATALIEARGVLGEGFDPEDKRMRDDLEGSIAPAIERLRTAGELPRIARLSALKFTAAETGAVLTLLSHIEREATTLDELAAAPDRARRAQLYAKVSAWVHEHDHADDDTCPVCMAALRNARDPVSGAPVADHLSEASRDRDVIARTVAEWSAHWVGRLLQEIPGALSQEVRADLPTSPACLQRGGLAVELFDSEPFGGALSALRADSEKLIDERLSRLPEFQEPTLWTLPPALAAGTVKLQEVIGRIERAIAFAAWREEASEGLKSFLHTIRRGEDGDPDAPRAIGRRLTSLLRIVEGVAPLNAAAEHVRRMEEARAGYALKQRRVLACGRATNALDLLVPLGSLAEAQVETLRRKLHNRSEYWRRAIYRNATTFAPDLIGTGMDARGVLELKVGRDGVSAPAQHIANASALRGALLGFFLAFREHVLATRGGLALLVLDDPQELLDNDNRQRLAHGLASVVGVGAQLLVTTHDRRFARSLVNESRTEDRVQHLSVHAVNSVHSTLTLSPTIEEVDRRRQDFLAHPDTASDAQNYASDLRVFIEARIGDLFNDLAEPAHAASTQALTLFPLVDKLRGLINGNSGELFSNPVLKRFVDDPALSEGAAPRRVLNTSHHDKQSLTYMDVKDVDADFVRLRKSVEKVHEQFRLHRWREPLAPADASGASTVPLPAMVRPTFSVPVCPDIAAFVGSAPSGGSQDGELELVDGNWFENKALYYLRSETLGFAIPSGSVAIVEAEPYAGRDRNLVIARYQGNVLARRLTKAPGTLGISLAAEMPDPRSSRPTLTFDESKVRLHRIVGAVFTDMPPPAGAGGEATAIDALPELLRVETAYRVREGSAVPLALPGQMILGGAELATAELDAWEGRLVAVTLDDGTSIFKRVGSRLRGRLSHLRQFEAIGGLGSSMVVAVEASDFEEDVPVMASARRVLGVLYD